MQPQTFISENLSKQIGNLFYAIAKIDSALTIEEYLQLSHELTNEWAVYGTKTIAQIKKQFTSLQKQNSSPVLCFTDFITYLHNHPKEFSSGLKQLIFDTGNEIAYAYAKINKSELNLMARLSIEFKKAGL